MQRFPEAYVVDFSYRKRSFQSNYFFSRSIFFLVFGVFPVVSFFLTKTQNFL